MSEGGEGREEGREGGKERKNLYTFTKTNRERNPLSRRHFTLKLTVSL